MQKTETHFQHTTSSAEYRQPGAAKRIAVVIINYKTPGLVLDCLASLETQLDPMTDVAVVVDNASGDGSVEMLSDQITARTWGNWVRLVLSAVNKGFSGGNNLGIRSVDAEYYLLLNSDTVVRPDAIAQLLRAAEEHSEAYLISPRLEWPDGTPQVSCFRSRTLIDEMLRAARTDVITKLFRRDGVNGDIGDEPCCPAWTSFAAVLIRRSATKAVGLLDEGYFMYYDDIDYCQRLWQANMQVLHWPAARIVHLRGRSGPTKELTAQRKRPPRYWYASRSRYYAKYYGRVGLWAANFLWWIGRCISFAREAVGNKQPHTCQREWLDIWINAMHPLKTTKVRQS